MVSVWYGTGMVGNVRMILENFGPATHKDRYGFRDFPILTSLVALPELYQMKAAPPLY